MLYDSIRLVQNSAALNGTQRVVFDDVITEDECAELSNIAHVCVLHATPIHCKKMAS